MRATQVTPFVAFENEIEFFLSRPRSLQLDGPQLRAMTSG
jgi:hypothetical protein